MCIELVYDFAALMQYNHLKITFRETSDRVPLYGYAIYVDALVN